MEIPIIDLLTKEHKAQIQSKLTEAIENIDVSKITKQIEKDLTNYDYGEYIFDEIDFSNITEKLTERIKETIFSK